jgi:YbgC/YbaW family acyl-CoA thioester hydrolase
MHKHESVFGVRLYDLDTFGDLRAATWLRFMWQAATDASSAAGFDLAWYQRAGTIWLIRRTILECLEPVSYGEEITIRTWVSDIRRVRSQREYEMRRADRTLVARGSTDWVYVDRARGKPIRVAAELQRGLMPDGVIAQPRTPAKPLVPPPRCLRTSRRVEFAAIDSLAHVNNAVYAIYLEQSLYDALATHGWALDPLARRGRLRVRRHDLEYLEAALYGDRVTGRLWISDITRDGFCCAQVLERDSTRLLEARSEWHWVGGELPEPLTRALTPLLAPA